MISTITDCVANSHLHFLLGLTPVEPVQLGAIVSRAPPPVLCKASHGPTQLYTTHTLDNLWLHMLTPPQYNEDCTLHPFHVRSKISEKILGKTSCVQSVRLQQLERISTWRGCSIVD